MTEPMILRFGRGGPGKLTLRSDPDLVDVCRTEFIGDNPDCEVNGRTLEISYPQRWWWFGGSSGRREAAVTLSERTPWRIEVRGGLGKGTFDLSRIDLDRIQIDGGVGKAKLELGQPRGTVAIEIQGGMGHGHIERPAGVGVHVRISGGAGRVSLDGQSYHGVGGSTDWATSGYDEAADRYEITIRGGCGRLSVEEV